MPIYELDGVAPKIAATAWVAPGAVLIGQVELADDASVWYGAVLRGDGEPIRIGARSNVQDGTVIHTDDGFPALLGEDVTVGHQVVLHGCTIGNGCLIGIQAVVLSGAVIGEGCLVGAGALVTEGSRFEPGSLIIGAPAKAVRLLKPEQIERVRHSAAHYVENAARHRQGLKRVD
jgi:carbonic anhydrase/acetyltransferase-like protein (isoleucine patch superfamily)